MRADSLKNLAVVVSIFFFTSNLSGSFLPVYFRDSGLSIAEIVEALLFTFVVIGLLPLVLLKFVKSFERIITFGIFFTMLFFIVLIYVRNPVFLGLTYGLGIATFWPSFHLLLFRLSESHVRARTISLFSSIIPSITSIAGPAIGGFTISNFGFPSLFAASIILYCISFLSSTSIKFEVETHGFSIPKVKIFAIFFSTFILLGLSEAYWLAYPFFIHKISGTIFQMGLVLTISAFSMCAVTFLVNWLSDIKRTRVDFALIGAVLNALWCFAIPFASTVFEIVALSLLLGLASAFSISWLAHYADSFSKKYYASILILLEVGFMVGRILNLAPTYVFISRANYTSYFTLLGVVWLSVIPLYVASKKAVDIDKT